MVTTLHEAEIVHRVFIKLLLVQGICASLLAVVQIYQPVEQHWLLIAQYRS
jgi:hypothetical protein